MSELKRILYITDLVYLGGGEKGLLYIIEKLDKERYLPIVLCPRQGPLVEELEKRKIKVILTSFGIAKKIWGFFPLFSVATAIKFFKIIKWEDIDLVHANSFTALAFSALPTKLMRIPLIWNDHGWSSGAGIQGLLLNFFVTKILTVSNAIKNFISKPGIIPAEKIKTIFLGVDLKEFSNLNKSNLIRDEFGIKDDLLIIGMIARFQRVKGHYYFFEAAEKIKRRFPKVKFLVVGAKVSSYGHESRIPAEVSAWIKEFALEEDVICTGFRNDIPDILSALGILVLPSLRESFGLILIEAMAAGVPVVATQTEGPGDIIENNVSGILVPVKDSEAISKAVTFLIENKDKAEQIKLKAKRRVEELFNLDVQVKKIESVYEELTYKR